MTREPRRFDAPSAIDALALLWGLAGFALIKLGTWLAAVPDCDVYPEDET